MKFCPSKNKNTDYHGHFSFLLRMGKEALLLKHFACFHISKKDWEFFPTLSMSSSLSCHTYKLVQTMGFCVICFCCTWSMHSLLAPPACMGGFGSIFLRYVHQVLLVWICKQCEFIFFKNFTEHFLFSLLLVVWTSVDQLFDFFHNHHLGYF